MTPAVVNFRGNLTDEQYTALMLGVLATAVQLSLTVQFTYDGKERIVEIHALGKSTKDGSFLMRGVQVGGEASRELPQWTLFSLDKIEQGSLSILGMRSSAPRDGYKQGDKQMDPVLLEIDLMKVTL
jgi:hypothetical protein